MDGKTNRESNLAVSVYKRRRPEESVLHQIIRENWLTFRDTTEQLGRSLPVYVQKDFERLVDCGVLARGFARVHCPGCGYDRLVAFACKSRSLCSSCVGRHMNETSAYLVDDVIGEDVSVRHWVCTLPPPLRYLVLCRSQPRLLGRTTGALSTLSPCRRHPLQYRRRFLGNQ